jgi:hypothetical protein
MPDISVLEHQALLRLVRRYHRLKTNWEDTPMGQRYKHLPNPSFEFGSTEVRAALGDLVFNELSAELGES